MQKPIPLSCRSLDRDKWWDGVELHVCSTAFDAILAVHGAAVMATAAACCSDCISNPVCICTHHMWHLRAMPKR